MDMGACVKGPGSNLGAARDRIVLLARPDRTGSFSVYCVGFNFAKNFVVTARHCLVDPESIRLMLSRYKPDDSEAVLTSTGPLPQTRAIVVGQTHLMLTLKRPNPDIFQQSLDFSPFKIAEDIVVLELDGRPQEQISPPFPTGELAAWAQIAIPAVIIADEDVSRGLEIGGADGLQIALANGIRTDVSPLCASIFRKEGARPFVFHACQTRFGHSGGPIFRVDENGILVLVGVHNGSVDSKNDKFGWPYEVLFPNYGAALTEAIKAANRQ